MDKLYVFTFTRFTQWNNEFVQAIAQTENKARELINDGYKNYYLESVFLLAHPDIERVVFYREYDNPCYEG